jgi:hypothetical protein
MRVDVTDEDILVGVPEDCGQCPVALALSRLFPDAQDIAVRATGIWLWIDGKLAFFPPPPEVVAFVESFDAREHVDPFSFDVPIVPPEGGE